MGGVRGYLLGFADFLINAENLGCIKKEKRRLA